MILKPIGKAQKDDIVGKQIHKPSQLSTKIEDNLISA